MQLCATAPPISPSANQPSPPSHPPVRADLESDCCSGEDSGGAGRRWIYIFPIANRRIGEQI